MAKKSSQKKAAKTPPGKTPATIATEIRSELRSILRQREELYRPIDRFAENPNRPIGRPRFHVLFGNEPPGEITGLQIGLKKLNIYDELMAEAVTSYAKSVWHLKDRLKQWVATQGMAEDIEAWAETSSNMMVTADLANYKKHGENRNRSGVKAFAPDEDRRVAEKLEIHHRPKHGSWLNIAEIELGVFERDLPERVGDQAAMAAHVAAWEKRRNEAKVKADWQFTADDARIKLRKLYPTIHG